MKKLLFSLVIIIASVSAGTASMNVDADSNTFIDVSYGGTNSNTAAGARSNLGLGNVDNTSDLNKPISTAVQTALNAKQNTLSSYTTITNLFGSGACSGYLYSDGTCDEPAGTGDLLSTNNLSDLASAATARTNLNVYSISEADAADDTIDEAGSYTITGSFDYSDGTIILPFLTLDPYDSGWEDSQLFASQGDVYGEMELKANASDLANQTAFESAFFTLPTGGSGSISISSDIPTTPGSANLNDTTHILTIASSTGYTQFTGSFTSWDTTPTAFSFTDVTDATLNTLYTSDAITVAGIDYPSTISISGNSGEYEINTSGTWLTTSSTVELDDTVKVRQTSSGSASTQTDTTLTIGGVSDTYSVTTVSSAGECDGLLVCQNFEGTGFDNSETWSNTNGDEDYTTTVLRGSQSLAVDLNSGTPDIETTYTATGEVWLHFLWAGNYTPGLPTNLVRLRNGDNSSTVFYLQYDDSSFKVMNGSVSNIGSYTLATDYTTYHFWAHLDAVNKSCEVYIGTTTTRPETPVVSLTSGDSSYTSLGSLVFTGPGAAGSGTLAIIDQVYLSSAEFTTVSE